MTANYLRFIGAGLLCRWRNKHRSHESRQTSITVIDLQREPKRAHHLQFQAELAGGFAGFKLAHKTNANIGNSC